MIVSVLRLLCRALFRVEVRGESNVTPHGKMLVIANHESFLDGMLLRLFPPFRVTFVVHTTSIGEG